MTITYPRTSLLEQALWACLTDVVAPAADVVAEHPRKSGELDGGKGRVVVQFLNDGLMGRVLTRHLSAPALELVCYATDYPGARSLQELVISTLEGWEAGDFQMDGQTVDAIVIESVTGPTYDSETTLFFCTAAYRFRLRNLGDKN